VSCAADAICQNSCRKTPQQHIDQQQQDALTSNHGSQWESLLSIAATMGQFGKTVAGKHHPHIDQQQQDNKKQPSQPMEILSQHCCNNGASTKQLPIAFGTNG
jgi:hypothetical protein